MASLKEMRSRIASVKSTQKITKAIQMVAAAKLRRSQEAAEKARPYAQRMAAVIANLAAGVTGDGGPKLLVGTGRDQKQILIVATADRGLAGGFNSSIIRAARERISTLTAEGKDVRVITLGRKANAALRRSLGDRLIASATEISRSGRSGIYDIRVTVDGVVVAEMRGHSRTIGGAWIATDDTK